MNLLDNDIVFSQNSSIPAFAAATWRIGKPIRKFQEHLVDLAIKRQKTDDRGIKRKPDLDLNNQPTKKHRSDMPKVSKYYKGKKSKNPKTAKNPKKPRRAKRAGRVKQRGGFSKTVMNPPYGSYFTIKYQKPRSWDPISFSKQTAKLCYNQTFGLNSVAGRQGVNSIGNDGKLCRPVHMLRLFDIGSRFWNATTSSWVQLSSSAQPLAAYNKFMLLSAVQTIKLTNQSPSTCEVDVYFVQSKVSDDSPYEDPSSCWTQGLVATDAGIGALAPDTFDIAIESKPTSVKNFNMKWRIIKKLCYTMNPGTETKVVYKFKPNRYFDTAYCQEFQTIRGISHDVMFAIRGVSADTTQGVSVGTVTLTPAKMVGTSYIEYTAKMCSVFPEINVVDTNLPTLTFGTGNLFSIADASGTVVNNNQNTVFA